MITFRPLRRFFHVIGMNTVMVSPWSVQLVSAA
jgi:hypothetical protein